ncbi:MAG TPA: sugar ABC transporter ATP-binding protein, partial [Stellaceae bacterium]|nr:sugar ABC transporter ATP-binding protein [Stellaceae bacterium]
MISPDVYRATGIKKGFAGTAVLHGIDFTVRPGTIHGLLGHNGAGKSTLLKILAGVQPPDEGTLAIGERVLHLASPREALSQGIACVYQELRLIPNLTVTENLFLGRELKRAGFLDSADMLAHTRRVLADFGLRVDAAAAVRTLSHPDKQMVEVVANLDSDARFLLLDEPTTALDGRQAEEMLQAVRRIATERSIGVVLVSHKLDEVLSICDEATVLSGGRVVLQAERAELTKAAIVDAIVGDGGHRQVERECRSETLGRTVIKVRDLKGPHLDGVNLQAAAGEVLGIYGLVGSGRTRFLRTLMGLEPMTGGTLDLAGQPYTPRAPAHAQKAGIAFLSEERKRDGFIPQMSAFRNVVLPTLRRYRRAGLVDHRGADAAARTLLGRIGTRGHLDRPIKALSGGNQQKVLFGRIIEQDAQLILLDEPTKGVDIGAKA